MSETSNQATLLLFNKIKDGIPTKEDGKVDIEKLKELLLEGDKKNYGLKYISGKLPEFFVRGFKSFIPIYKFSHAKLSNKTTSNIEEEIMTQIRNGDFSTFSQIEELYPKIRKIVSAIGDSTIGLSYDLNEHLWKNAEIIPDSWKKDLEKYKDTYNEIIKNEGMFEFKDDWIYEEDQIDKIIDQCAPEEQDKLKFCKKIISCYKLRTKDKAFDTSESRLIEAERKNTKSSIESINQTEAELKEIEKQLKSFGFFKSLFKKKEKQKLEAQKEKKQKELNSSKYITVFKTRQLEELEFKDEFRTHYRDVYSKAIQNLVIPKLREQLQSKYPGEEQKQLTEIFDNIANSFLSPETIQNAKSDPISAFNDQIDYFNNVPVDSFMDKYNNALYTVSGLANTIIKFGNSEHKDLYSLLGIIRGELNNVPTDSDHGKLEEGFRTHNLNDTTEFFEYSTSPDKIESVIEMLNQQFANLMNIEDTEEYIKKSGELYYKFILCHPYADGNGRTSRYLINTLLAHRGIVMPALYNTAKEQYIFNSRLNKHVIHRLHPDFEGLGEEFLDSIIDNAVDFTENNDLENIKKNREKKLSIEK